MSKLSEAGSRKGNNKDWPRNVVRGTGVPGQPEPDGWPGSGVWAALVLISLLGLCILFYDSQREWQVASATATSQVRIAGQLQTAARPTRPPAGKAGSVGDRGAASSHQTLAEAATPGSAAQQAATAGATGSLAVSRSAPPAAAEAGPTPAPAPPPPGTGAANGAAQGSVPEAGGAPVASAVATQQLTEAPALPAPSSPPGSALALQPVAPAAAGPRPSAAASAAGIQAMGLATVPARTAGPALPMPALTTVLPPVATLPALSLATPLATSSAILAAGPTGAAATADATAVVATTAPATSAGASPAPATTAAATETLPPPNLAAASATPDATAAPPATPTPTAADSPTAVPLAPPASPTAAPPPATAPAQPAPAASSTPAPSATAPPVPATDTPAAPVSSPTALPPPTATPAPSPQPTAAAAGPADAALLVDRVNRAEGSLFAGRIITTTYTAGGSQVQVEILFDLRPDPPGPRLETRPLGPGAGHRRLVVGGRAWQRQGNGPWQPAPAGGDAVAEVRDYLFPPDQSGAVQLSAAGNLAVLSWHDAVRAADIALTVDPADGTPRQARLLVHTTGEVLIVDYSDWNLPPGIKSP